MARTGIRVTLAIEPTAHDMFLRSGGGNGKSSYVSAVIQQRWRAWQHALSVLRGSLTHQEIAAAMRAVAASWEFYDMKRCQDEIKATVSLTAAAPVNVAAICTLAGELAAGNAELEAALAAPAPRKKRSA